MKEVNIAVVGAGKRSGPGRWLPLSDRGVLNLFHPPYAA
jgi:hypothetical protein